MNRISELASALIHSRQHVSPKRLIEPGPTLIQKSEILDAAGAAPDHGKTTPWHFYEISHNSRPALGEVFAQALLERDPTASKIQIDDDLSWDFQTKLI